MTRPDVLITVPTRGMVRWETVTALEAARDYLGEGTHPILYQPGNLSVAMTRNRIVKRFLETDLAVLAMVDDDIAPPVNFVEMLLPYIGEYGMVAIPHSATHAHDPRKLHLTAYEAVPGEGFRPKGVWTGINQVDAVATGCVLIGRPVFDALGPAPFRVASDPGDMVASDDLLFCIDLHDAGFKVGAYWDGHPADHFTAVNLTPLTEEQLAGRRMERRDIAGAAL